MFSANPSFFLVPASYLRIATQFWIFPVATLVLMVLTVVPVIVVGRYFAWREAVTRQSL